jgi:hypothetical protein
VVPAFAGVGLVAVASGTYADDQGSPSDRPAAAARWSSRSCWMPGWSPYSSSAWVKSLICTGVFSFSPTVAAGAAGCCWRLWSGAVGLR